MDAETAGARRRELQRRAFAAGGGLSDAEAVELRELDARVAAVAAEQQKTGRVDADPSAPTRRAPAQPGPIPADADGVPPGSRPSDQAPSDRAPSDQAPSDQAPSDQAPSGPGQGATRATRPWRRPGIPAVVLSALVALLLGFGGGWLLQQRLDTPSMSAQQAAALAEIEKTARFDPGSIVYLGQKHGASVWRATRDDGKKQCLAIHVADQHESECVEPTASNSPFADMLSVSASRVEGDKRWWYWANVTTDVAGREVLIIQRQNMQDGSDWRAQFTEVELPQVELLVEHGVAPEFLQVLGYDGEQPIFYAYAERTCLYAIDPADGAVAESCDAVDGRLSLTVGSTIYEMHESETRGPTLTVVRSAEPIVCDVDTGYCGTAEG